MKLARSSLCAALATLGVAAVAPQVQANPAVANSATPDLTLIVWDTSKSVTYFRDLGQTWSQASAGTVFASSMSFAADSTNWSNFLTALGGGLTSSTFYDVVSGTLTPSGTHALVTTGGAQLDDALGTYTGAPNDTLTKVTGNATQLAVSAWQSIAVSNAATSASQPNFNSASPAGVTPNVHGSNISVSGDPGEASTAQWQNGFGQTAFTTFANVGTPMNFFEMFGGNAGLKSTVIQLSGEWLLSPDGTLTYSVASVPEAETWVLLLCGMAVLGPLARRRRNAR